MDIAPEFNRWEFSHTPPLKPGKYQVKIKYIPGLGQGHFTSEYKPHPITGKLCWECEFIEGFIVTHWKF